MLKVYFDKKEAVIEIVDSGPGFEQHVIDKLFKYFTATDIMNSEGLGLSIAAVKLIMDAHEGRVEINNGERGAVVKLLFPF